MDTRFTIRFELAEDTDLEETVVDVFELLLKASYESCGQADLTGSPAESQHEQTTS